jgi:hypothetical protein
MNAELDGATIADWCRRSRESQGLPATITDGAVLAKIVTLALAPAEGNGNGSAPSRNATPVTGRRGHVP